MQIKYYKNVKYKKELIIGLNNQIIIQNNNQINK
jgi:hypothetical protein